MNPQPVSFVVEMGAFGVPAASAGATPRVTRPTARIAAAKGFSKRRDFMEHILLNSGQTHGAREFGPFNSFGAHMTLHCTITQVVEGMREPPRTLIRVRGGQPAEVAGFEPARGHNPQPA